MVDANIYGWTYTVFHAAFGWDVGDQTKYEYWENFFARKIDAYVFTDSGTTPRLTDAAEMAEAGDIVNELLATMNIYLKGESAEGPIESGFFDLPGFPTFTGDPEADNGLGTGHYRVLNKLRKIHSQEEDRVDSIWLGPRPSNNPFYQDKFSRVY